MWRVFKLFLIGLKMMFFFTFLTEFVALSLKFDLPQSISGLATLAVSEQNG